MRTGERSNMMRLTPSAQSTSGHSRWSRRTRSPLAIGSFAIAFQISPCTRTGPASPAAIGVNASPASPTSPSDAGNRRGPLRRQRQPHEKGGDRREPERRPTRRGRS